MSTIGDYFSWAAGSGHGFLELVLFCVVIPAVVLLVVATVVIWILVALKWVGGEAGKGFSKGWNR